MPVILRETEHYKQGQKKGRDKLKSKTQMRKSFEGKAFGDLTEPEKDDLLKVLAIQVGIIEE